MNATHRKSWGPLNKLPLTGRMGLQQRGALFTDEGRLLGIVSFYKGWAWGSMGSLPWRVAGRGGKCVQYTGIKAEGAEVSLLCGKWKEMDLKKRGDSLNDIKKNKRKKKTGQRNKGLYTSAGQMAEGPGERSDHVTLDPVHWTCRHVHSNRGADEKNC
ncbi:hypothetical protein RRG08_047440 [Elysia crispata]|uniref:Uncharacterized protein n=1 Tax=Elysia crispata TaxID=231223 RepID=A0AAE0YTW8_9GAST|nr:hypothetical protein RRG08_047440 [Elysia crispata]